MQSCAHAWDGPGYEEHTSAPDASAGFASQASCFKLPSWAKRRRKWV
eukprot:CAMPEP_0179340214 /NCGR_PEP_ID=MMETSP0797-20121207/69157_1 /TAXON_ID=47934 /ORGANISM="Dinophysis acuminata, Strain DAEP01" /LENGTH=46 /DNA_ID= /DNA_START= /DNA_END= /DNA_ORIENTATION=